MGTKKKYIYRTFINNSDIPWTVYDQHQDPHTLEPGESKTLIVNFIFEDTDKVMSKPPVGMQGISNLYRNPETGRMEIEFQDLPQE